ncbi:MAG: hypothetical protein AAF394_13030, partial [Planctomycetota bacterium]
MPHLYKRPSRPGYYAKLQVNGRVIRRATGVTNQRSALAIANKWEEELRLEEAGVDTAVDLGRAGPGSRNAEARPAGWVPGVGADPSVLECLPATAVGTELRQRVSSTQRPETADELRCDG